MGAGGRSARRRGGGRGVILYSGTTSTAFLLTHRAVRPLIRYGRWLFLTGLVTIAAKFVDAGGDLSPARGGRARAVFPRCEAGVPSLRSSESSGRGRGILAVRENPGRPDARSKSVPLHLPGDDSGTAAGLCPFDLRGSQIGCRRTGQAWLGTEPIIQLLALVGIAGLFGDATGPLFRGLGYPHWILSIEAWQSSLVIVLLWSLTGRYGVLGAALAWLVAVGSSQVVSFILARRIFRNPLAGSALPLVIVLLASLVGALTAVAVTQLVPGVAGFLIAVSAAACATMAVLWFCDERFELGLRADLSQAFPQVASLLGLAPATR